jgi:hypothetical protein
MTQIVQPVSIRWAGFYCCENFGKVKEMEVEL